jgi:hypothetical protein
MRTSIQTFRVNCDMCVRSETADTAEALAEATESWRVVRLEYAAPIANAVGLPSAAELSVDACPVCAEQLRRALLTKLEGES